jgi:hypothetical protein
MLATLGGFRLQGERRLHVDDSELDPLLEIGLRVEIINIGALE